MVPGGHASERAPGIAQLFKKPEAEVFHIVWMCDADGLPSGASGFGQFAKTRTKEARSLAETLPARFVQ